MRIEREQSRQPSHLSGIGHQFPDQGLVTKVDAIERADRQDRFAPYQIAR